MHFKLGSWEQFYGSGVFFVLGPLWGPQMVELLAKHQQRKKCDPLAPFGPHDRYGSSSWSWVVQTRIWAEEPLNLTMLSDATDLSIIFSWINAPPNLELLYWSPEGPEKDHSKGVLPVDCFRRRNRTPQQKQCLWLASGRCQGIRNGELRKNKLHN